MYPDCYILLSDELVIIRSKRHKKNQLCFAVMLKHFQLEGHHPRGTKYIDPNLIGSMATQLDVKVTQFHDFDWEGRSTDRYREEIREFCGYRATTNADLIAVKNWLTTTIFSQGERQQTYLANAHNYFKNHCLEPPATKHLARQINTWHYEFETQLFISIHTTLPTDFYHKIDSIMELGDEDEKTENATLRFSQLKRQIAGTKLKHVDFELEKLDFLRSIIVPEEILSCLNRKLLKKYYTRIQVERPSHIQEHPKIKRYAMMAIYFYYRTQYVVDNQIDLLLQLINNLRTRAESHTKRSLVKNIKQINDKYAILHTLASASVENPTGIIEDTIYPQVSSEILSSLVEELNHHGRWFETQVHTKMYSLYSHSHRRVLLTLLDAFTFRTRLTTSEPLLEAITFIKIQRNQKGKYYPKDTEVTTDGIVPKAWIKAVVICEEDDNGNEVIRIQRMYYEIAVLQTLYQQLQCKMIWVDGAYRHQDPDRLLPKDFEEKRAYYYSLLDLPTDVSEFLEPRKKSLHDALKTLNADFPNNEKVTITDRDVNIIKITPADAQDVPQNIQRLHADIHKKWLTINLIDILKETDLQCGFTQRFYTAASRQNLPQSVLQQRLLLCLYAIGTNAGLSRIAAANDDVTYEELRYTKRQFIDVPNVRAATIAVINKTLAIRDPRYWSEATTTVACDSKRINVWDQNLMSEWHTRYKAKGVMVYWHVDQNSLCIYSQLKTCSSSEVGSLIKGILQHGTKMTIDKATMDTHGQSLIGFGIGEFLKFDLLPRLKNIARQKLYYPFTKNKKDYPNLEKILKSPIDWRLIEENYDETVKHIVSLKLGMIDADMFVKRLSYDNYQHPVYRTLLELGKIGKTQFLCRYFSTEHLRIEINASQNIVERLNSIMGFIFYGKLGEIRSNEQEDQELAIACLHLLQACMGYINTLLVQDILGQSEWQNVLTMEDKRALNVLFHRHINPYGLFPLDLDTRLGIGKGIEEETKELLL